jgi:DNA-binding response OmpR family regulator
VIAYDISNLAVLLVKKNISMRSLLRSVLRELGITNLRDTGYTNTAFDMHIEKPADLVMTDWSPGLDGMKLLRRLRIDEKSQDPCVPVIIISAYSEMSHVYEARDLGMTEYLAKPISASLVFSRIRSVIERRRLFVRDGSFFGPDRRRRKIEFDGTDRRDHGNYMKEDRRHTEEPFEPPEKRHGFPGHAAPEARSGDR